MKLSDLENNIKQKKSFLCLGLDTDIEKIQTSFKTGKSSISI